MARSRRIFLPGLSLHVIKRGNNRQPIFQRDADRQVFLAILRGVVTDKPVIIHGFVLMSNHYHLIVTPETAKALPNMMKELNQRYVTYYNREYQRVGTLWAGRYRGIHLENDRYWLTCLRYIEQNPVRAGMVRSPDAYSWSSYAAHAFGRWPEWLTPHSIYQTLGNTAEARQAAYRGIFDLPCPDDHLSLIR